MRRTRIGAATSGRPNAVRSGSPRNTPAASLSLGASEAVRPGENSGNMASGRTMARRVGSSPGIAVSKGATLAARSGPSEARALARGRPRFAEGGYLGFEKPMERLNLSRERNKKLGTPHYSHGGSIEKDMRAVYNALHSHFENSPPMKKLGATKKEISDGVPQNYLRKKKGGVVSEHLWIQSAINPSKKGALHKSLGVPSGKKIPEGKLEKAAHSKSPLLRKRAQLAETLRGFHRPRGR